MSESVSVSALRKAVANGFSLKRDKMSRNLEYKHLLYQGEHCIAKFKVLADAECARDALIEREVGKLLGSIRNEPSTDVRPSS